MNHTENRGWTLEKYLNLETSGTRRVNLVTNPVIEHEPPTNGCKYESNIFLHGNGSGSYNTETELKVIWQNEQFEPHYIMELCRYDNININVFNIYVFAVYIVSPQTYRYYYPYIDETSLYLAQFYVKVVYKFKFTWVSKLIRFMFNWHICRSCN